ncbi:translocator of the inner chloroplast membrane (nucleomorph) [Cryptomonas paramecium]|uniref:Translocator of the inner chloroplast membrane n=1 Tax=Cryptomonas paramaecium TaxID=2898 RepID=F2HH75_9CRYP|nr:translocator of the inner chloroplast membrane [Cryptomonas paramecium]AEA38671.1 translocator of the inner chloroplast membrane [Cryptomonas paramecium]|mmetsp:Transcript_52766/g.138826  ORF Transcript_52766/g.138826 Transcript_52766/m.138826 type:complete len:302 (+) Transcript_52766:60-965(+)
MLNFLSNFNYKRNLYKKSKLNVKKNYNINFFPDFKNNDIKKFLHDKNLISSFFISLFFVIGMLVPLTHGALENENFHSPFFSHARFSSKNYYQKLSQIPVFAITNSSGQPYLTTGPEKEQIGLIFFSHEDALALLTAMKNTHQVSDARIYIMGLDRAYRMVTADKTKNQLNQDFKTIFRFYPDQKQVKNASLIVNKLNFYKTIRDIPVFVADGLVVKKGKDSMTPVFFSKEDLEKTWKKMISENPDINVKPTVLVVDLLKILKAMENDEKIFSKFGFFPSQKNIEFIKKENKTVQSARMLQ